MTARYDVFVSHNGREKPLIERLCIALQTAGIEPWFDEWALAPGDEWIREVEHVLDTVPVVLVCFGVHGVEPWQDAQRQAAIERAVSVGKSAVVPLLLPGAPVAVELPGFLRGRTPLDLRAEAEWGRGIARLTTTVEKRRQPPSGGGATRAAEASPPARASAAAHGGGDVSDEALIDELARVLYDSDQAMLAARNAGFPVQSMPTFRTAQVFWSRIVEDARNGAVRGGVGSVASVAAKLYPGNAVFIRYRAR
jgi:hypothetical protein